MSKLVSTEEMLIPEEKRELYREAMELHLKKDIPLDECIEIVDVLTSGIPVWRS